MREAMQIGILILSLTIMAVSCIQLGYTRAMRDCLINEAATTVPFENISTNL